MIIKFFAAFEESTDSVIVEIDDCLKVREMLPKILKKLEISDYYSTEKYCFIYGKKYISSPDYIDRTLKEVGLKSNRNIKVWDISHLTPA